MGIPIAIHCIKDAQTIKKNPERLMEFNFETQPMGSRKQVWQALAAIGKPDTQDEQTGVMPDRSSGIVEFDDGSAWEIDLDASPHATDQVNGVLIEMRGGSDVNDETLRQRFSSLCAPHGWTAFLQEHDPTTAILYAPDSQS